MNDHVAVYNGIILNVWSEPKPPTQYHCCISTGCKEPVKPGYPYCEEHVT